MADDRKYEPVHVEMIGLEDGHERFSKDGNCNIPPLAKWRNNLTALSQHHNLFFIASNDCIAIYLPEFPYQTLRTRPVLLIKLELANRYAGGYISSARGGNSNHAINHLVVGDLGSQEIVVVVTDSGNVEAYYTSAILEAIHRANQQETSSSDILGLRPFFSYWVRQSTWGIDIHKEARMIAVSANTPSRQQPGQTADPSASVTVFAFALIDDEAGSPSSDQSEPQIDASEWTSWPTKHHVRKEPVRDKNYKITLAGRSGHENNIPNISFVNTSDDSEGTWLLSTDITGAMKLWQIWSATCFRTWFFGSPDTSVRPWMQNHYPGWNVAALDVNCFRTARSKEEFIGASKAPMYYGYHDRGESYNITPVVTRLPGNSQFHPSHPDPNDQDSSSEQEALREELSEDDNEVTEMDEISSPTEPPLVPDFAAPGAEQPQWMHEIQQFDRPVEFQIETESDSDEYDDDSEVEDNSIGSASPRSPPPPPDSRQQRHIRRQVTPMQDPNAKTPDIAMIHCSDSHIRLLGSPKAQFPHIFSANILRQLMPPDIQMTQQGLEFAHMDRLNMLHVIKEIGVMLIATQTGRVAVCALTRSPKNLLGLRVDWILPTKRQERRGRRPDLCPLVGIAVAPVQGRTKATPEQEDIPSSEDDDSAKYPSTRPVDVDGVRTSFDDTVVVLRHKATPQERHAWDSRHGTPPEPQTEKRAWKNLEEVEGWRVTEVSRRYRLMLTYSDLSVLTYEISRGVEKGEIAP